MVTRALGGDVGRNDSMIIDNGYRGTGVQLAVKNAILTEE